MVIHKKNNLYRLIVFLGKKQEEKNYLEILFGKVTLLNISILEKKSSQGKKNKKTTKHS